VRWARDLSWPVRAGGGAFVKRQLRKQKLRIPSKAGVTLLECANRVVRTSLPSVTEPDPARQREVCCQETKTIFFRASPGWPKAGRTL